MILNFSVKNYKSIKDKIELNLTASSTDELLESNVIKGKRHNILKSAVIYGHNASGKSNFLDALVFYRWFINNSAKNTQTTDPISASPFMFCEETENEPSWFEMTFLLNDKKYRYGFSATRDEIHKEWLLYSKITKEYPLFLRNKDEIEIYDEFKNATELRKLTRNNALFLSVCSQFNIELAEKIVKYLFSIDTLHGLQDKEYQDITIKLLSDDQTKSIIEKLIKKADLGIQNVEIIQFDLEDILKEVDPKEEDNIRKLFENKKKIKNIFTTHDNYKNDQFHSYKALPIGAESEGTKKYFNLLGSMVRALKNGTTVVIDEFDARLHPIMVQTIVKLFNSKKIHSKAQLILTAHNPILLDNKLLRRDQIYFIEKNKFGASHLYSLLDYKPRKNSPYNKNYLAGRYGAIPIIDDIEDAFNNN